jgi:uncharacterized protein (DUF433 family)
MEDSRRVVHVDPETMSGAPVFTGTRVPIRALLDHLAGGDSIDDFLDGFPSVTRDQVIAFLRQATDALLSEITPR